MELLAALFPNILASIVFALPGCVHKIIQNNKSMTLLKKRFTVFMLVHIQLAMNHDENIKNIWRLSSQSFPLRLI